MDSKIGTVEGRTSTFKRALLHGKTVKWAYRQLSMIGMARAFYYYEPLITAKDRVVCAICSDSFVHWNDFKGRPITRHAESGRASGCFVAELARIALEIDNRAFVDHQRIKTAAKATFQSNSVLIPKCAVEDLSSEGFILLSASTKNKATVGCVCCNCFPQNALGTPKHTKSCLLHSLLSSSQPPSHPKILPIETQVNKPSLSETDATNSAKNTITQPQKFFNTDLVGDASTSQSCQPQIRVPLASARAESTADDCGDLSQRLASSLNLVNKSSTITTSCVAIDDPKCQPRRRDFDTYTGNSKLDQTEVQPSTTTLKEPEILECRGITSIEALGLGSAPPISIIPAQLTHCVESTAIDRCFELFDQLRTECGAHNACLLAEAAKDGIPEESLMNRMELLTISMLEEAHAKRIQLINSETERVVTQLLKTTNS